MKLDIIEKYFLQLNLVDVSSLIFKKNATFVICMFSIYFSIFYRPLFGFASVKLEQVLVTCYCYLQVVGWILNKLGDK